MQTEPACKARAGSFSAAGRVRVVYKAKKILHELVRKGRGQTEIVGTNGVMCRHGRAARNIDQMLWLD